jgi:hypothetical protein
MKKVCIKSGTWKDLRIHQNVGEVWHDVSVCGQVVLSYGRWPSGRVHQGKGNNVSYSL